ncbi:SAM-dependent methyltransferase [Virgibacillus litoralis]|uniref:SAM-dependent methyltransferase n=2 Tax=Virgibacillus litoralis TaxID=578221 RepID=A0ABS4H9L6_9BACI|nr:SAM-dependent methyltransferase [Virgibacillus litoralis]
MSYQQMSTIYDRLMNDAPYDQWQSFTINIISQLGKSVEKIVDLGCGTGQITTRLAREGYRMTGVDYSSDMLSYAEQRASTERLNIQWIHQNLINLNGVINQDVAVSYCDVINYITQEDELQTVFQNAADSLKIGGLFIFDVHSLFHVEHNMVNQTFGEVNDDVSYIWFCSEGEEQGEMYHDLTFFVADQKKYSRFDEYHHQRTYSVDFYSHLLKKTGFKIKHLSGDFSLINENINAESERIFIVAEKRSEK